MLGKDWRQKVTKAAEDEMVSVTNSVDIKFEQTPGDSRGQESLAGYSPWGCKELDTT